MRLFFRIFWLPFYRRWALGHIKSERVFEFERLKMRVPSGVFHPLVFLSTPLFVEFLKSKKLVQKTVLDLGTGSGLLAIWAKKNGASEVVALDVNALAVETCRKNAEANSLIINVLASDLFKILAPRDPFDIILINPPYYPKAAATEAEKAFFAGPELEYFKRLFAEMPAFGRLAWLIVSEDCDLKKIMAIGEKNGWRTEIVWKRRRFGERFFVLESRHV